MKQFGENLLSSMKKNMISQSDLARRASQRLGKPFGRDSVSQYVRGVSLPNAERLRVLADVLGVPESALLPTSSEVSKCDHPVIRVTASDDQSYDIVQIVNCRVKKDKIPQLFALIYGD
jgi:transcriptional regulator with XRE-family HTH domain